MNLMIVTNSLYLKPAYVMLYSLFENHRNIPMDIYLPYEGLSREELSGLARFCEKFQEKRLHPLYVGTAFKEQVQSKSGINVDTYYRILGINLLLKELDRILYLDVDMVIQGSLLELYETDLRGKAFAVCEDIFGKINSFHKENMQRLGIPENYTYFNAGVMLFHLDYLRAVSGAERMMDSIYQNYERYYYNDQDVMNELFYDQLEIAGWDLYNCPPAWYYLDKAKLAAGRLEFLDYHTMETDAKDTKVFEEKYQNMTRQIYQNARIIHYLAATKPWLSTRKQTTVYDLFDGAYWKYANELEQMEPALF